MITRSYRVIQHLSIDIVIGAVILLHFFSSLLSVPVSWKASYLLAVAVWLIYTIDHIKDSLRAKAPLRERYSFHLKHKRWLLILVFILGFSCIPILLTIEVSNILITGMGIVTLSAIFLLFQREFSKIGIKEVYVAMVYSLGILITPLTLLGEFHAVVFINLFLITCTNLILFSWNEENEDKKDGFISIAVILGFEKTKLILVSLCAIGLALSLLSLELDLRYSFFVISFIIYLLMILKREWFINNGMFRTIGDGVFLLPALYLL